MSYETEHSQALEELRQARLLMAQLNQQLQGIDARISSAELRVDEYIAGARSEQGHWCFTENQELEPNEPGTFWNLWSSGAIVSAQILETVVPGVAPADRSPLAREFLRAVNSDVSHIASTFRIWEIVISAPNGSTRHLPYQKIQPAGTHTAGAVVKHISGPVPTGWWCQGLQAGESAKICISQVDYGRLSARNVYTFTHPVVTGPETENCVIQVAMPAVVSGYLPAGTGWGLFPKIASST